MYHETTFSIQHPVFVFITQSVHNLYWACQHNWIKLFLHYFSVPALSLINRQHATSHKYHTLSHYYLLHKHNYILRKKMGVLKYLTLPTYSTFPIKTRHFYFFIHNGRSLCEYSNLII